MPLSWDDLSPYGSLVNTASVEPRAYQISITKSLFSGRNTLIVLPTGLGKTLIAVFAIARALQMGRKALVLAPTRPLNEQHYKSMSELLNIDRSEVLLLTGSIKSSNRMKMEGSARVIVATPQTFSNDLKGGRVSMDDFGIVIFDECHRAVGKYAYTYIADECRTHGVQVIGLTASPGSDRKKINALITALEIQSIEMRISTDPDVAPYVMRKDVRNMIVETGRTISTIMEMIRPLIEEHLMNLYSHGLSPFKDFRNMPKGRLLQIGDAIRKIEAQNYRFMGMYNYIYVLNLLHAYDLAACEGIYPFVNYIESLEQRENKSRTLKGLLANKAVISAKGIAKEALDRGEEHPKMLRVAEMLKGELKGDSAIIFAQYRSTTRQITDVLKRNGIEAREFVGKKAGITQHHQQETISAFRDGLFRVLVATSIGEEGLDIPTVDTVIFYEPIPSEIRNIQRRGRAGRMKYGRIFIMVSKGTKDEAYLFISMHRELKMRDNLLKAKMALESGWGAKAGQKRL